MNPTDDKKPTLCRNVCGQVSVAHTLLAALAALSIGALTSFGDAASVAVVGRTEALHGATASMSTTPATTPQIGSRADAAALSWLRNVSFGNARQALDNMRRAMQRKAPLFVNREESIVNCTRCSVAVDRRLGGQLDAFATDVDPLWNGLFGSSEDLMFMFESLFSDPSMLRELIGRDEANPVLRALRSGETSFRSLVREARPLVEASFETLTREPIDFSGFEKASLRLERSPLAELFRRNDLREDALSLRYVAKQLGRDVNDFTMYGSDEAKAWFSMLDSTWVVGGVDLSEVAARSQADVSKIYDAIDAWEDGSKGIIAFSMAAPAKKQFSHVMNVMRVNGEVYFVDGQLGRAYTLDTFRTMQQENLLIIGAMRTGSVADADAAQKMAIGSLWEMPGNQARRR